MQPYLEAKYTDGYIHSEKKLKDSSPYVDGKNIFYDILEGLPEAEHGPMIELNLHLKRDLYQIDWTKVPADARPIRLKHMRMDRNISMEGTTDVLSIEKIEFGYQWTDKSVDPWKNNKEVIEI